MPKDAACNPFGANCVIKDRALSEQGKKFRIVSDDNIVVIKVDKCLIKSTVLKKVDYLILNCDRKEVLYLELKGQNLKDAAKQIIETKKQIDHKINISFVRKAAIVQSEFVKNDLKSTSYRELIKIFKPKNIIKKNSLVEY
jgi:hypothetical protein